MFKSLIKLIIGDLDEKRAYKKLMKRVKALPEDYQFTFRKIQQYMYRVGSPDGDITMFTDLTMFRDLVDSSSLRFTIISGVMPAEMVLT